MKVEYLHADFGTGLFINPPVIVGATTVVSRNVTLTEDFVRAGVNWKFAGTQVGKWIVGVEGQYDWGKVNSTHVIPPFPRFSYNTTLSNFATLAGRAGYTVLPQAFLYCKAGGAFGRATT